MAVQICGDEQGLEEQGPWIFSDQLIRTTELAVAEFVIVKNQSPFGDSPFKLDKVCWGAREETTPFVVKEYVVTLFAELSDQVVPSNRLLWEPP